MWRRALDAVGIPAFMLALAYHISVPAMPPVKGIYVDSARLDTTQIIDREGE